MKIPMVQRYTFPERVNHWVVMLTFLLLLVSGLAWFYPSFYWMVNLLGGGTCARILHPFIGVVMFISFLGMTFRFWKDNRMTKNDYQWLGKIGAVLRNDHHNLPEIGRYNPGQKLLFKTLVVCMLVLMVSGVIMWQPYFAPLFCIDSVRWAILAHSLAAFVLISGITVHVYAAIFWITGSFTAMTTGLVTRAWARKHHPLWYREVSSGK
ncbi:MAG: formate dehydrogenase subunit gamma [Beggiatoa sp. IS2]|nr:MAG: formate dehydrogenase subunit gamma [Beggiatoa sp. IS2]